MGISFISVDPAGNRIPPFGVPVATRQFPRSFGGSCGLSGRNRRRLWREGRSTAFSLKKYLVTCLDLVAHLVTRPIVCPQRTNYGSSHRTIQLRPCGG